MAINKVILFGRLTREPDINVSQSGTAITKFTIATDRKYINKQTGQKEADFINCVAFGRTAEFIGKYFEKGSPITVEGSLQNNNYTDKNGAKHYTYIVLTESAGFGIGSNSQTGSTEEQNRQLEVKQSTQGKQRENSPALDIGDLSGFEDVISDGNVPF